jgi:hypothetical protein
MSYWWTTDNPKRCDIDRACDEVLNILRDAHRRMDILHYPQRPSHTRPIDDRDTTT